MPFLISNTMNTTRLLILAALAAALAPDASARLGDARELARRLADALALPL